MKKIIPILISIFLFQSAKCQELSDRITGVWKVQFYLHNGDTTFYQTYWDLYHFDSTGHYEMVQMNIDSKQSDTLYNIIESGLWSVNDSVLKFSKRKMHNFTDGYFLYSDKNKIEYADDNSLIFRIGADTNYYDVDYYKTDMNEWNHLFSYTSYGVRNRQFEYSLNPSSAFQHDFLLVNASNTSRTKKIKGNISVTLEFERMLGTPDSAGQFVTWVGMLHAVTDTTLSLYVWSETIQSYDRTTDISTDITYSYGSDLSHDFMAPVEGTTLSYTNNFMDGINSTATAVASISLMTALFVAPLASIRYKEGGFNEHLYFTIAGSGIGTMLLMLPVMFSTDEKSYPLAVKKQLFKHGYWYVRG